MTVRDPYTELELRLAREKAGDFEWAFNRLVEIVAEECRGPEAEVVRQVMMRSFGRLHDENVVRQAERNRGS